MNEDASPTFGFGYEYAGEMVYCEIIMNEGHYGILFNGRLVAQIEFGEDSWILSGGLLPDSVVEDFGKRIESYYS